MISEKKQNQIRNFSIISHIDHGKSTLADRFLEFTKTIPKEKMRSQYLDMMDLEREKGITIKMQPVRLNYISNNTFYTLNLIDTPGHIDFSYEVSRALAAVEGAILLVDAIKGIQAQTIANLTLAKKQNLVIIPVINKIDLEQARIQETKQELSKLLNISEKTILEISAKFGKNIESVLKTIIQKIPNPEINLTKPFRGLIFDSKYDTFKGIIAYVRIIDGEIGVNEKIYLTAKHSEGVVKELGYFKPEIYPQKRLCAGEIGYIATGIKEPGKVRVGDTIIKFKDKQIPELKPLAGYEEPKPMVFISFYPENPNNYELLKDSLEKLKLNDAALFFEPETKKGLGRGFRCGFLGQLHAEITSERITREYNINLVISAPSVIFKIIDKQNTEIFIKSPSDWIDNSQIKESMEPWIKLEVISPFSFFGSVLKIIEDLDGKQIETKQFGEDKILLNYETPLREIISGFYDKLKGVSQGYASMNYQILDYRPANLIKLEIFIAGEKNEIFSKIVSKQKAYQEGKKIIEQLKKFLPPQLFSVALQAVVNNKVIARETMRAKAKDVIAPLYGGDYTRKRKLLEKQKKGKKELKEKGIVHIPQKTFLEILKNS